MATHRAASGSRSNQWPGLFEASNIVLAFSPTNIGFTILSEFPVCRRDIVHGFCSPPSRDMATWLHVT